MVHALLVDEKATELEAWREASKQASQNTTGQRRDDRGRSRSPYGDRARSPHSDRTYSNYGERGGDNRDRGGDRGGGERRFEQPSFGDRRRYPQDRPADRYGRHMSQCKQCGCAHLEEIDSKCPWRPVDEKGKLRSTEFNGWDPVFWGALPYQIRSIMTSRVKMLHPSHEAYISDEVGNRFIQRMEEHRTK